MYDWDEYDWDTCWEESNDWADLAESERAFGPDEGRDDL